ncbi:MAG: hypothetical protein MJ216_02850 [Bacilli bacterium]|nr:hypothetical protein [Bacilli bacterium]
MKKISTFRLVTLVSLLGSVLITSLNPKSNRVFAEGSSEEPPSSNPDFSNLSTKASLSFSYDEDYYKLAPVTSMDEINEYEKYVIVGEYEDFCFEPDFVASKTNIIYGANSHMLGNSSDFIQDGYGESPDEGITFYKTEDKDYWTIAPKGNKYDKIGIVDNNLGDNIYDKFYQPIPIGNLFVSSEENGNCNYHFDFSFDEDGNFIVTPYSTDGEYINKNRQLTLLEYQDTDGYPNICFNFETKTKDIAPLRLYREIQKPDWKDEHYQRVYNVNNVTDGEYILVTKDGLLIEQPDRIQYDTALYLDDSSLEKRAVTHGDSNEFVQNNADLAVYSFENTDANGYSNIKIDGLGYIAKDVPLMDMGGYSSGIKFVSDSVQASKFKMIFSYRGVIFVDNEETPYYLANAKGNEKYTDEILYSEQYKLVSGYVYTEMSYLPKDEYMLYKKVDMSTVWKNKVTFWGAYSDVESKQHALSLKIALFIPSEVYSKIRLFGSTLHYYMTYSFNDGTPRKQELFNVPQDTAERPEGITLSVVFRNIPLTDIDVKFNAYASYSILDKVTYDSLPLNNGEGYTIRSMAERYISDYENDPATYEDDIGPHIDALKALVNLGR